MGIPFLRVANRSSLAETWWNMSHSRPGAEAIFVTGMSFGLYFLNSRYIIQSIKLIFNS